eukprot:14424_1
MSTSKLQWKVGQRAKVFTSKTSIPQWITGNVIHETNTKVCIQFDGQWIGCIDKHNGVNVYEWFHKNNDNKIVIKHLNQERIKYCKMVTYKNEIRDSWKKGDKVEIYSNSYQM